jgi:hypothetical protein
VNPPGSNSLVDVATDLRKTQNGFAPFVVGPSVDDTLPEANRTCIRHH